MPRYAEGTKVPIEQSEGEVKLLLRKHQADQILTAESEMGWTLIFRLNGRQYRFNIEKPDPKDKAIRIKANGYPFDAEQVENRCEAEMRRRWRVLILQLKAAFESAEETERDVESILLPHVMLPNGMTVAEVVEPQLQQAYATGQMPQNILGLMLPGRGETER